MLDPEEGLEDAELDGGDAQRPHVPRRHLLEVLPPALVTRPLRARYAGGSCARPAPRGRARARLGGRADLEGGGAERGELGRELGGVGVVEGVAARGLQRRLQLPPHRGGLVPPRTATTKSARRASPYHG